MLKYTIAILLLISFSCKEQEFAGANGSKKKTPVLEKPTVQKVEDKCANENTLKAKLLSDGLSKRPINNSISYELELISCEKGTPISLQNEEIHFDIDATGLYQLDLLFRLIDPTTRQDIYRGTLSSIQGQDLFGKSGQFSHNKSPPLNLNLNTNKVIIEIFLQDKPINSIDGSSTINSYFRVGSSDAVVQIIPLKA